MVGITGRRHLLLALCVGALLAGALSASEARACGGFFCSQVPMEQRGERIVFGFGEGRVSSIIQIDYTGEAEDFGWVVPVTGVPTSASVAPLSLFNELTMRTEPSYYLDWQVSDQQCGQWMYAMDSGAEATAGAGGGHDGVEIAFEQEVGPYNVTVLSSTDAAELLDWLDEHGFDQPGESVHLIQHYLDIDMKFAAVKLKRGASVGEVQPLRLDFEAPRPCVPLVLTRIAALPDMPVYIWVLAETRAVPPTGSTSS